MAHTYAAAFDPKYHMNQPDQRDAVFDPKYHMNQPDQRNAVFDPKYHMNQPDQRDAINTLYISGLPEDVKAREIHNLFRRRPGFQSCQLKYTGRGTQVVAFATFVNNSSAIAALHSLNGVKFDPQNGYTLNIELAKSNSRRKISPGNNGAYVIIDKRNKFATDNKQEASSDDEEEPSRNNEPDFNDKDKLAVRKSDETSTNHVNAVAAANEHKEKGDVSTTLFIANLGPTCNENELKEVFSHYPGFNIIKFRSRVGMPVAFADFKEFRQASYAMESLQGRTLPSSDRGGMHIEFARSKMRK
ncbi:U2 small nuclear ribonucleoprotein B''-like [Impatiens glandulifera]|uniref:U2 small nuclear ribonucleoprotein B''-like n=1 Tax=Impatiens glandulifera TaxID=253017 RepID=UPI001FB12956|nr:U2 small nuclear ribonucleoprotein B''-like [Impatiens glandulifera]